jgi:signal transduction histidine kinase
MLYGLAQTLSLYDAASVRVLVREMGRRIREYLEELGYDLGSAHTPDEALGKAISFFVDHDFVDLEIVDRKAGVVHARWLHLLGLRAYARIAAAGGATFISCPLNAVAHDSLAAFGKELVVREKHFDLEKQILESWEEIVDIGPEVPQLSLDPERILELEREQSRQLRVRDEFIRIASHELSTPLTSMKLAVALLEPMKLPDVAGRSVAVLKRQIRRLELLVAEMLDTTRLQIGRLKLDPRRVDLVELVGGAIDSLALGGQRGSEVSLSGEASLVGWWDAARLDQVVTNLLTNARKFGEGRPVDVEVRSHDGRARLVVRDHGIGIPPEAIGRIFGPFERAVPVEKYAGLGLGLYIARRFVEMHGGQITVESVLGQGAAFTVELPLECPREANVLVEVPIGQREAAR